MLECVKKKLKIIVESLAVMALLLVPYLLLGPLEIYSSNKKDFTFAISDFFGYFLVAAVGCCIVYAVIMLLIPEKVAKILNAVVFSVGVLSYLQCLFMNRQLSSVDGGGVDWNAVGAYKYINLLIWIAGIGIILIGVIKLSKYRDKVVLYGSAFLIAIQLVAIVSLLLTTKSNSSGVSVQPVGDNRFKLGREDNIVLFVMDNLGNVTLDNVIADGNPELIDYLHDFTRYTNADSHFCPTFPSITHMLTGENLDYNSESLTWLKNAYDSPKSVAFYDFLKDIGYEREIFMPASLYVHGDGENLRDRFDNVEDIRIDINNAWLLRLLAKYSSYRYVPYVLKPYLEVLTSDFNKAYHIEGERIPDSENSKYYLSLLENGLSISDEFDKAFIFDYIQGVHSPNKTDAKGNYKENATLEETTIGCMNIFRHYIDELEKSGVYDNTTIILTADHGQFQPVFFMKRAGERHDKMEINSAPISHDDLLPTIVDIIGGDYTEYGTSIFDWKDGDRRERTYSGRDWMEGYPEVKGGLDANVYKEYIYFTDGEELREKVMNDKYDNIQPATPWDDWVY